MEKTSPKQVHQENAAWLAEARGMSEEARNWRSEQARALAELGAFTKALDDFAAETDRHEATVATLLTALEASPSGARHDEAGEHEHRARKAHAELKRTQHALMTRFNSLAAAAAK